MTHFNPGCPTIRRSTWSFLVGSFFALLPFAAQAQTPNLNLAEQPPRSHQYIVYTAEPQLIQPNHRTVLELRFHVLDGFHVNSHTPHSELLLPTTLELEPTPSQHLAATIYPTGQPYRVAGETLDVYTGAFTLLLPVTVPPGEQVLNATLHYQACDRAACYPPRTLQLQIPLTIR